MSMRSNNRSEPKSHASAIVDRHFDKEELAELVGTESEPALAHLRGATWHLLAHAVSRPGKEFRARMVEHAYAIAKTHSPSPSAVRPLGHELPQILELIHAGSLVIDDVEDNALMRRGAPALHRVAGVPAAVNAGNFLYFLPMVLLSQLSVEPAVSLTMHQRTARALLRCHHGQGLDLAVKVSDVAMSNLQEVVELTTTLKTGALMNLACALGALAGGADARLENALSVFGCEIGIALQMLDDLSGFLNPARMDKGVEDLMEQRATWAWAFASKAVDEATYRGWQQISRDLQTSSRGANTLYSSMKIHLEAHRHAPKKRLTIAFDDLKKEIGTCPAIDAFAHEIDLLEKSYV